jgi:hypothetical protein
MRIVYIADDGKEFDDEYDCLHYEWRLNHPNLKDVHIYDEHGKEFEDIFSEDTYGDCMKITVPTDEAAQDMQALAKYTGHCYYAHIKESGTWKFDDKASGFVLVSKEIV